MISRRAWVWSLAAGTGGAAAARALAAQERGAGGGLVDTSNLFPMDQSAARSVRLPAKPGAAPAITADERDALEHQIRCQCGCTLDVYTCRTTDFSCQVSPQMHRDILALVRGGYSADEIRDAFVGVYGERVLMAPPRTGFNLLGYIVPGIAIGIGAIVLAIVIRRWRGPGLKAATVSPIAITDATPDELRRLEAAVRDDS